MSELTTLENVPESPSGEEDVGGSEDTGFFAGGESPGLDADPPVQQGETPPKEQVTPPEQQVTDDPQQLIPAKEDSSRFEYWQSQANKHQKELDELKGSQLHSIAKYIQKNPDMLDVVEDGIRGGQTTRPQGTPEKPARPQKPENYDVSEAHDPDTASGRYRADYDTYLEKKDIYNDVREDQANIQAKRNEEKIKLAELRTGLVRRGGLNESEADEFLNMLDGPESKSPEVLAKFYRVLKAPAQDEIANQEKARQLLAKKQGLESPPPLAKAAGEAPPPSTDEDDFHAAMRAGAERGIGML